MADFMNCHYKISTTTIYDGVMPHTHTTNEIIQCFEDYGKVLINGKIYPLKRNGLYFIDGIMPHCVLPNDMTKYFHSILIFNNTELKNLCHNLKMVNAYKTLFSDKGGTFCSLSDENVIKTDMLMFQINKELHGDSELKYSKIASNLVSLFDIALNSISNTAQTDSTIVKILSYINNNVMSKFTLDDLSDSVNVSKYHMCRMFKEHLNISIGSYITNKRLSIAKHMLLETNYTITEIAENLSFSSQSTFSAKFIKEVGCSPTEFRTKYK